jgi:PIN domain nuclease of toxin-antitoxin system
VNLLLDTHALLWWLEDSPRLLDEARTAIGETDNAVHVSAATVWEISIKTALGKLDIDEAELARELARGYLLTLHITGPHAWAAGQLPRHHDDPFDRMLIAQAAALSLTIVTHDRRFAAYGAPVLWT